MYPNRLNFISLETGKEEYMERGISALRASWALQLLSEYKEVSPGNLRGVDTIDEIDRGCISENYGHSGRDERIHNFILFDWGNGTASTITAYVKKHFGDLYIDFKEQFVFGIDGLNITSFSFKEEEVSIELEKIEGKDNILIKCRETPSYGSQIIINSINLGKKQKFELDNGFKYEIII